MFQLRKNVINAIPLVDVRGDYKLTVNNLTYDLKIKGKAIFCATVLLLSKLVRAVIRLTCFFILLILCLSRKFRLSLLMLIIPDLGFSLKLIQRNKAPVLLVG